MRLNQSIKNEVIRLYKAGEMGSVNIGRKLGISYQSVLRVLRFSGTPITRPGGHGGARDKITPELKALILDSARSGTSVEDLSRHASISKNSVYRIIREARKNN